MYFKLKIAIFTVIRKIFKSQFVLEVSVISHLRY